MIDIWKSKFIIENFVIGISLFILLIIPRYTRVFWSLENNTLYINKKTRLKDIDTIKGLSILAVIIIHSCYLLFGKYNGVIETITLSFINNIFRFAIPVFLFSSGLLLGPFIWKFKYILKFYSNKLLRIGIPYIFVNLVLWKIGYNNSTNLWQLILTGNMSLPFYFVPVLFQLYLLYPILDYIRQISPKYLLIGALIISISSFFISSTWEIYGFPLFGQYLVFFVYGMLRQDILLELKSKSVKIWVELLKIYMILQIFLISIFFIFGISQNTWEHIYFYNFQPLYGLSVIFISLYYLQSKKLGYKFIQKIFAPLGKFSLWIFLLHFPIQQILFGIIEFNNLSFLFNLFITIILTLVIVIPLACFLDYAYSKIKF